MTYISKPKFTLGFVLSLTLFSILVAMDRLNTPLYYLIVIWFSHFYSIFVIERLLVFFYFFTNRAFDFGKSRKSINFNAIPQIFLFMFMLYICIDHNPSEFLVILIFLIAILDLLWNLVSKKIG